MSWLHGGLGRLLHSSKGEPTAESSQPGPKLPAQAGKPKGDSGLMTKQPSPRSWADAGSQAPDTQRGPVQDTAACSLRRTSETQQLLDGPGSVYALLPCIKQLRPSRNAADQLAAAVLGALPGVKLDSSWMVYPAGPRSGAKKTEGCICILPDLQPPVRSEPRHAALPDGALRNCQTGQWCPLEVQVVLFSGCKWTCTYWTGHSLGHKVVIWGCAGHLLDITLL